MRTLIAIALLALTGHTSAATIYLCKAYNGSTFWAQQPCSKHNALIERMESVADVPWEQQVQQAEQRSNRNRQQTQNQRAGPSQSQICNQLINERRQIESRYTNWQWQPPEVINPDQQRTRAINAQLRNNDCRLQ